MDEASKRRSVLKRLRLGRIVPSLSSDGQTVEREESSAEGESADASNGASTAERESIVTRRVLTPEERILELLAGHGGRMKQGEVVENVEWSESTVSRKLKRLESTGDVTRFRLGREKHVFLPGREPDALASPFAREEEKEADALLVH